MKEEYDCDICSDNEVVGEVIDGLTVGKPCKCAVRKGYERMLKRSGIRSEDLDKKTFATFETEGRAWIVKEAKKTAMMYAKNFGSIKDTIQNSICFLTGRSTSDKKQGIGAGKTHLSIAIANMLLKNNIALHYMSYRDTMTYLKQHMIDDENYQRAINIYKNIPVLLIDDLFKGRINDTDINIMFEIINHRYLKRLPIIVSSEFSQAGLLAYDEGIGSRIIHMCKDYIIEFNQGEGENNLNYRL